MNIFKKTNILLLQFAKNCTHVSRYLQNYAHRKKSKTDHQKKNSVHAYFMQSKIRG